MPFAASLRRALTGLMLILPGGLSAQDWATRAVCDVPRAEIFEDAIDTPLARLEAEAAKIPNGTGRFWKITAPSGAVSHLWGTHHGIDRIVLDLPDALTDALGAARVVALEIDPVYPTRAAYDASVQEDGRILPADIPGRYEHLSIDPRVDEWIRDRLDALGWGRDAVDYLTLGGLAEILLWSPCEDFASGVYPSQDTLIQTLGYIAGARIVGLEPVDRLRLKLDDPDNEKLAEAMIQIYGSYLSPAADPRGAATDFALYLQGRIGVSMAWDRAAIAEQLGPEGIAQLRLMDSWLLDERNRDFVAAARADLMQGGAVIAVGSFHLPGDQGMVALLRKAGFDVARVPLPGEAETP